MASDKESLLALEGLMTEFFNHLTTNERKKQIEELLNHFGQQLDSWRHCLFFLGNTNNEYVMMYCMTVLEKIINRQWMGFHGDSKIEIRSNLSRYLLTNHEQVPGFVRNKLVKLVVDIGRLDWPHFYPDFFSSILQLLQQSETTILGLLLLHTTSEELACPREDLSVARKDELHRLLLQQVPLILNLINNLLQAILEKHRSMVTATPPPSPTHGESADTPKKTPMSVINSSPAQSSNILSNMFKSPRSRVQMESLPPLDTSAQTTSYIALNCLSHLFSWIPLSTTITPHLLSTIFHFTAFGCEAVASSGNGSQLGIVAMCCINELLDKNCVPTDFQDYLLQMFQQTFHLLQRITQDNTATSTGNRLADLDESYVEKFTEFLRLFVSIHLRRFEANSQFPMLDFLGLLYKYTFQQASNEGFYACLDIWMVFLDYVTTRLNSREKDQESLFGRYKDALLSLVSEILQKIQFRYNQSQLDGLDDEILDDDYETEWQHYLRQCAEVIAKVSELHLPETFNLVYLPFMEYLDVYRGLEKFITTDVQGRRLNITAENECRRLHCMLRDLSSLLQLLGRMADHFTGENYQQRINIAKDLFFKFAVFCRLTETCGYGSRLMLYETSSPSGIALQGDFIELHAQTMAAVKAYAGWLALFYMDTNNEAQPGAAKECILSIVTALIPLFNTKSPEKIVQSAAHLLLSLLTTVRPPMLLQFEPLWLFYEAVSGGSVSELCMPVQILIFRALSHYLLLPWPNLPDAEQQWQLRGKHHHSFIQRLTSPFCQLRDTQRLDDRLFCEKAKPCVKRTLQVLTDIVQIIAVDGTSRSKQLCYQSLQEPLQITLQIFPVYIQQSDIADDILGFFLALFQGLRGQMGVPFTQQTIQTFMNMFSREQLQSIISEESTTAYKVVEKFLRILQVIVQDPSQQFRLLLPHIISICTGHIYPIIAERPSPDIKPCLYEVLYDILLNNWRYFFKASALESIKSQNPPEEIEHQDELISIIQAFGQSFLQSDIGVFRQNLEALEGFHLKKKLYNKNLFKTVMLEQFLTVLMQVLINRSHDLLQEEIGITIYNMASSDDFKSFHSHFLPTFLQQCAGLDDNQKTTLKQNFILDQDLPSFTQSICRLVNDLRYYQQCNNSLPAGSVKL